MHKRGLGPANPHFPWERSMSHVAAGRIQKTTFLRSKVMKLTSRGVRNGFFSHLFGTKKKLSFFGKSRWAIKPIKNQGIHPEI